MQIKTVTTKVHTASFAADDIKSVALSAVKGKLGVSDDAIASSDVTMDSDGSLKVEIVETVPAEAAPAEDDAPKADAPVAAFAAPVAPAVPTGPVI